MKTLTEILGDDYASKLTEFLFRCKNDFKFFCERVLDGSHPQVCFEGGMKEYMLEWQQLIENNPRVAILAPRGFAKTTIFGIAYPIWLAFTRQNLQIMVISKTIAQARRVLSLIKGTIENNELLCELKPENYRETWSSNHIKMSSGCGIFCKPYTDSVKGERVHYVVMDEASSYDNTDLYFDYILPTLDPKIGRIALISTPESSVDLMTIIGERKLDYVFKKYTAIKDGKSIWPERFPLEKLAKIKEEQGEQFFEKNFMCNMRAEGSNTVFSSKSILACTHYELGYTTELLNTKDDAEVYIGCDFAIATGNTADFDCYVVVERINDRAVIKFAETIRGISVVEKVMRLKSLYEQYNPLMIIADESGIGQAIIEKLRNEGLPVQGYSFQHLSRNKLLNNLKVILDNKRLVIPKNREDLQAIKFADKLEEELLSFKEMTSKTTNMTSYVSTGAHDDAVMGLALAVSKIRQYSDYEDTIITV